MDYRQLAFQTAQRHGIDPDLFARLIQQESSWDPSVISHAGAIGLGQLMPETAAELGVDPYDPAQNLDGAARYYAQQLARFGSPEIALAAYNAGPGAVQRHGGIPPYQETRNYVAAITGDDSYRMRPAMDGQQPTAPQIDYGMEPMAGGMQPWSMDMLSRPQRMMLGFAALRDAGASLLGQNSSHFADALGGIQDRYATQRELEFRRGQEARLRNEQLQATRMNALQGLAQLDAQEAAARRAAEVSGQPYVPSPYYANMRYMLEQQLAGAGMAAGAPAVAPAAHTAAPVVPTAVAPVVPAAGAPVVTPAPAAAPAVAPQQTAAPQAMNQRVAASIASDPNATQAQRDEALRWLRSLSRDEQIAVGADSLVEQLVESGQAAGEREAAAQARAEFESGVAEQGQIIADYLVQGFDQRGEPILNPAVATAAGRSISETLGTAGYQQYVGAINFIKNNLTFDRLLSLKDQGATFGALSEGELRQIASSVSTLNVEDPLGTLNELRRLERTYGISFGLAPQQAPTRRPNARTTWED